MLYKSIEPVQEVEAERDDRDYQSRRPKTGVVKYNSRKQHLSRDRSNEFDSKPQLLSYNPSPRRNDRQQSFTAMVSHENNELIIRPLTSQNNNRRIVAKIKKRNDHELVATPLKRNENRSISQ